jgi:8-oxo-dGTP diphosphatase
VVIKDDKYVLLLKQSTGHDLPGGGVEFGETCEAAVVREVKEESGIDVTTPLLLGVDTSFFKLPREGSEFVQSLMFYYSCTYVGGELSTDGFDEWEKQYAEASEWIEIKELDTITVGSSNDFRPYIKQALSR